MATAATVCKANLSALAPRMELAGKAAHLQPAFDTVTGPGHPAIGPTSNGNGVAKETSPELVRLFSDFLATQGYEVRKKAPGGDGFFLTLAKSLSPQDSVRKAADRRLQEFFGAEHKVIRSEVVKAAMGETSGAIGGYVVPADFSFRLMDTVSEVSIIYPRANVVPMASMQTFCPKIDVETVQAAGSPAVLGGIKMAWGASQAPAETEPTFRQLELDAWDLLGYCIVANEWLEDTGVRGEEYLLKLFGKAAAWFAEFAFFQGTGSAQAMPLGVINGPGTIQVARNTPSTVKIVDVATMPSKLLPYSWTNAIWATNPTTLIQIMQITQFYINVEANPEGGQAGSLLTRPVFITEKLPALGTYGDLILFDPSLYVVGERMQVLIDVSDQTKFQNLQTVFRIWMRLDGKPQFSNSIVLQDASTTVAPYVALK